MAIGMSLSVLLAGCGTGKVVKDATQYALVIEGKQMFSMRKRSGK